MSITFPQNFFWGAATAAHQVEGNNVNSDFWLMEHLPGSIFAEPSGDAIDHYHRYPEDIAMLAELGFNSYRFSIEWARIEPEEGRFSQAALDHYRRMLEACRKHGLKAVVTFHHFTSPRWLITAGGWTEQDTAAKFARYCARAIRDVGDLIDVVCTINELNIPMMIQRIFMAAPNKEMQAARRAFMQAAVNAFGIAPDRFSPFLFAGSEQARAVMLDAHAQAVSAIKAERRDLPVGMTLALQDYQAVAGGEAMRDHMRRETQDIFLEAARYDDFVGVQTYSRERFGPDSHIGPEAGAELTQMNYEFWPEALEATLRYTHNIAGVPIMVTENGIGTADDARRLEYYRRALQGVANCLNDGLDIGGYFAWSAFDNFEWMLGYRPTFGIISVDRATQQRTPKPSARRLGEVAQNNAL